MNRLFNFISLLYLWLILILSGYSLENWGAVETILLTLREIGLFLRFFSPLFLLRLFYCILFYMIYCFSAANCLQEHLSECLSIDCIAFMGLNKQIKMYIEIDCFQFNQLFNAFMLFPIASHTLKPLFSINYICCNFNNNRMMAVIEH